MESSLKLPILLGTVYQGIGDVFEVNIFVYKKNHLAF